MKISFYIFVVLAFKHASLSPLGESLSSNLTGFDFSSPALGSPEIEHALIGSKRCIAPLGCFAITKDFFHVLYRPINFLPQDRKTIDTQFYLFTKDHPKEHDTLSADRPDEIKSSLLNPKHRTVFIVHGFFDSRLYGKWMEELKDNILLHSDNNVFIVDWSKGNGAPYTQAAANCRVVGAEIDYFIRTLQKIKGVSPMDCHIVGHSLGSHIAGYAGERLKKLGRISALDPAQPYFQNMPPSVRLDQTDADFVDVIHTDSSSLKFLALGMSQAIGHVDFYPNNGMNQPGCTYQIIHSIFLEGLIDASRRFVACNHQRSVDYFIYSINYKRALPVAYHCTKWEDYLDGLCAECGPDDKRCAIMGHQADQYRPFKNNSQSVKMYIATSSFVPYWEYSYQIQIKLKKPTTAFQDNKGDINLKIEGTQNTYDLAFATKSGKLVHGSTYTFLTSNKNPLGGIKNITFKWNSATWTIFRTLSIHVDFVKVLPMNVAKDGTQKQQLMAFCPKSSDAIKAKQETLLTECKK